MTADERLRVVFRADASLEIGTGHVMRCLTLAEELRRWGAVCEFVCRELPGHRIEQLRQCGFKVHGLQRPRDQWQPKGDVTATLGRRADAGSRYSHWRGGISPTTDAEETLATLGDHPVDWLVVDHYALGAQWEHALRPVARKIMVIDDLADRAHECELLLDQNLGRIPRDYDGLVPEHSRLLCGPAFALLRPEFAQLRHNSLARRAGRGLRKILITMGGVDNDNATGSVLDTLASCNLSTDVKATIVMGSDAPWIGQLQCKLETLPFNVEILISVSNMAQIMSESDFAIGAAGSTSWERCCLGLPSALVVIAPNQVDACRALVAAGAAFDLGRPRDIADRLPALIGMLGTEPEYLSKMSRSAARICNGLGVNEVLSELLGL